jgi:hypothetical protein
MLSDFCDCMCVAENSLCGREDGREDFVELSGYFFE